MANLADPTGLIERLNAPLLAAFGEKPERVSPIRWDKTVADATAKFLVQSEQNTPLAVVLCGRGEAGDLVQRNVVRANEAKAALGPELGQHVLLPVIAGEHDGAAFAAYEYCRPLRIGRLRGLPQRLRLAPTVLKWLREAARATYSTAAARSAFQEPLEQFLDGEDLPPDLRSEASIALDRLSAGEYPACHVLMHNDFWTGNIMLPVRHRTGPTRSQFVIIDWPGSATRGYGLYDLIRLAGSARLLPSTLRREVARHCTILGCDLPDARSHLAASIAALGTHLEHFPRSRYIQMSQRCFALLDSAGVTR